jgi:hypothetical protein
MMPPSNKTRTDRTTPLDRPHVATRRDSPSTPRILNCLPSPKRERDWGISAATGARAVTARSARRPTSVDLRDDKWWPISNQEATGSCVGWAVADGVLRWHFTTAGRIEKGDELSVRYLWMAAKERDEFTDRPTTFIEPDGTTIKAALDIVRNYGIVPAQALPFEPPVLYRDEVPTFYTLAARLRIATYHNLGFDLTEWRKWLADQGPIAARLDCDNGWMHAKKTNGKLSRYSPTTAEGGHAVAIVGYTPTTFIIRNSWGTKDWGDKGYAYASNGYVTSAFSEAYGVTL